MCKVSGEVPTFYLNSVLDATRGDEVGIGAAGDESALGLVGEPRGECEKGYEALAEGQVESCMMDPASNRNCGGYSEEGEGSSCGSDAL